jgi:hypothetical protein
MVINSCCTARKNLVMPEAGGHEGIMILVDTHVHVYPSYNVGNLLSSAVEHFSVLGLGLGEASADRCLCLTETQQNHFFAMWHAAESSVVGGGWRVMRSDDSRVLRAQHTQMGSVWVVAGRQVISRERLEVLALVCDGNVEDGQSLDATLSAIRAAGAVPVLSWAPGKWWGARGVVVKQALQQNTPTDLAVGDIPMRSWIWGEPAIMREAHQRGFRILAGTDPLPLKGEESGVGRYAMAIHARTPQTGADLIELLRTSLLRESPAVQIAGRRDCPRQMAKRMWALRQSKRGSG